MPLIVTVYTYCLIAIAPAKYGLVIKTAIATVAVLLTHVTLVTLESYMRGYVVISLESYLGIVGLSAIGLMMVAAFTRMKVGDQVWSGNLDESQVMQYNMNVFKKRTIAAVFVGVAVIGATVFGLYSFAISANAPAPENQVDIQATAEDPTIPPDRGELLRLVNLERAKANVAPLVIDELLNKSAQFKSDDMASRFYFSHTDPETGKYNGTDKAFELGAECSYVSENIAGTAYSEDATQSAMRMWNNSPSHYRAMVDDRYAKTGFGFARASANSGYVITQHFCIAK